MNSVLAMTDTIIYRSTEIPIQSPAFYTWFKNVDAGRIVKPGGPRVGYLWFRCSQKTTIRRFETSGSGHPLTQSNRGAWTPRMKCDEKTLGVPTVLTCTQGKRKCRCKDKSNTEINSVYYQWVRRGLSHFAEGTATHWHVMCAGEECSHCHYCKLAALWGRPGVMIGHLWTECSCGEPGSVGSAIKAKGSGTLKDVAQFYYCPEILKSEKFCQIH